MPRTIHENMIGHQLTVVLVGRSHIDLEAGLLSLFGKRTDYIVRLKAGDFQNRDIHRSEELFDYGHSLTDIFRSLGALRFVLFVRLMAERTAGGVKRNTNMRGVDFLNQIFKGNGKAEDGRGIFPFAVHTRGFNERIIRPENHRVGINKKQFFHGLPVNGLQPVLNQIVVCRGEMSAPLESAIDGKWRRVRGLEHQMFLAVDELSFALGVRSPEHEDQMLAFLIKRLDSCIGQFFPPLALMAAGFMRLYRQCSIEQ